MLAAGVALVGCAGEHFPLLAPEDDGGSAAVIDAGGEAAAEASSDAEVDGADGARDASEGGSVNGAIDAGSD